MLSLHNLVHSERRRIFVLLWSGNKMHIPSVLLLLSLNFLHYLFFCLLTLILLFLLNLSLHLLQFALQLTFLSIMILFFLLQFLPFYSSSPMSRSAQLYLVSKGNVSQSRTSQTKYDRARWYAASCKVRREQHCNGCRLNVPFIFGQDVREGKKAVN
jgi:hypothetical protein